VMAPLLIARALGALGPEVLVLLEAHLEQAAAAAVLGRELEETVAAARRALDGEALAPAPPLPSLRWEAAERRKRLKTAVRWAAAVAASVLLGIGIGTRHQTLERRPAVGLSRSGPAAAADPWSTARPAAGVRVWSASRWREQSRRTPSPGVRRLDWPSPVKLPRVRSEGGMTR